MVPSVDRRTHLLRAAAAIAFVWSGPAFAQPEPQDQMIEAGVAAGAFVPSAQHELYDSTLVPPGALGATGFNSSLRLAYFPFAFLGAELESNVAPMQTASGAGANLFAFRGHGIVQLPGRFTPFALIGGGTIGVSSSALGSDFDRAFHWGLGAKYYLSDRVAVRLDGRQIVSGARGPDAGNTSHFEVMAGFSLTLWRGEPLERRPFDEDPIRIVEAPPPAPEPVVEPTPAPVPQELVEAAKEIRRQEEQLEAVLARVHFAFGSAQIRVEDRATLAEAAELLARYAALEVEVVGHTDVIGTHAYNMWLSEKRAVAVRDYLVASGVDATRIHPRGVGPDAPLADNGSVQGRATNRRIEFNVVGQTPVHIRMAPGVPAISAREPKSLPKP